MAEPQLRGLRGLVAMEAEKHQPDHERGGCTCGFCAWSAEHVVLMVLQDKIVPWIGADRSRVRADAAAEELEAAASEVMEQHGTASLAAKRLRARAAALRGEK